MAFLASDDGRQCAAKALTMSVQRQQRLEGVLRRIQGEYIEMPGLRLTVVQAQRLWGLDRAMCDAVLGSLVDTRFLSRNADGTYARSSDARAARNRTRNGN